MISFAITIHNELEYLNSLIEAIEQCNFKYEIVILHDPTPGELVEDTEEAIKKIDATIFQRELNNDFASQKNFLIEKCKYDWIFQIDADETFSFHLAEALPEILKENSDIDMYALPRVNTVDGITYEHLNNWGWTINKEISKSEWGLAKTATISNEYRSVLDDFDLIIRHYSTQISYFVPVIMWPDYQQRLFRNNGKIKYENKVHEILRGYNSYGHLPAVPEIALLHYKDITRQEKQNQFYNSIKKV